MRPWRALAVLGLCLLAPHAMARPMERGEHLLLVMVVLSTCLLWRVRHGRD